MIVTPIKTNTFQSGENLALFIIKNVKQLKNNSILVVTSKIISLSEKRYIEHYTLKEKNKIIKKECLAAIKSGAFWLTLKDHQIMASAGVDESNSNGKLLLLPKNSYQTAKNLRQKLLKHYKIKNLGVLITDSRVLPLRLGVVGMALGYAGFKGLKDYRGQKDIFGRKFTHSLVDIPDSLASAAILVMGEGSERQPLAIIKNSPVVFSNTVQKKELTIAAKDDLYYPLLKKLHQISRHK